MFAMKTDQKWTISGHNHTKLCGSQHLKQKTRVVFCTGGEVIYYWKTKMFKSYTPCIVKRHSDCPCLIEFLISEFAR